MRTTIPRLAAAAAALALPLLPGAAASTDTQQDCGDALVCAQVAPEVAPSLFDDVIGQVDEFRFRVF